MSDWRSRATPVTPAADWRSRATPVETIVRAEDDRETPFSSVDWKASAPGAVPTRTSGGSLGAAGQVMAGAGKSLAPLAALAEISGKEPSFDPLGQQPGEVEKTPVADWMNSGREPLGPTEEFANRFGQTIAGAMPFSAGIKAAAPLLAQAGLRKGLYVPGTVKKFAGNMGRAIEADKNFLHNEAGLAALSGTGAGAVAALPGEHPYLETAAEVALPLSASVIGSGIDSLVNAGRVAFGQKENEERVTKFLEEKLKRVLGEPERAAIQEALRLRGVIGDGFKPTIAEAMFDTSMGPKMLATQRLIESRLPLKESVDAKIRYDQNLDAIRMKATEYGDTTFGAGKTPDEIVDTLTKKTEELRAPLGQEGDALSAEGAQLAGKLPEGVTGSSGTTIRERLLALKDQAAQNLSAMAKNFGLDNNNVTVPFQSFQANMEKKYGLGNFDLDEQHPGIVDKVINYGKAGTPRQQAAPTTVTFSDLMKLRSSTGVALRKAISNGDEQAVTKLAGMSHDLDNFIDQMVPNVGTPLGGVDAAGNMAQIQPALADKYALFRSLYKQHMVDPFKQGAAYKVRQRNGESFYQTQPEKVAAAFWTSPSGAKQFNTTFRGDPEATDALTNAVLDDLRRSTVRDGRVNPTLYDNWMNQKGRIESLNELPDVKAAVGKIGDASRSIAERNVLLEARKTEIENAMLTKRLNKFSEGEDPRNLVNDALKNTKLMGQIQRELVGSPESYNAFRRLIWDETFTRSPQEVSTLMESPSMKMVFGKDHLEHLKDLTSARKMAEAGGEPAATPLNMDAFDTLKKETGNSPESWASKWLAMNQGRIGHVWGIGNIVGGVLRAQKTKEFERLFREAFYNPDVAKNLIESTRDTSPISPSGMKLRGYLFNAGYDLYGADDESKGQ